MGHHLQGVLGPGVEPVDGAAVDEGGEHAQAVPEGVANGTHGCQGDRGGAKRDPGVEVTRARLAASAAFFNENCDGICNAISLMNKTETECGLQNK